MSNDRIGVFISSKMVELSSERKIVKDSLSEILIDAWVFEQDAGARETSIQETYLEELNNSDLYIGIFWKGYGKYTIDEFYAALKAEKDMLIYEKRTDLEDRDANLQGFLDSISNVETGLTIQWFESSSELYSQVKKDVQAWQARLVKKYKFSPVNTGAFLQKRKVIIPKGQNLSSDIPRQVPPHLRILLEG
jgi:hypothetical protein